MRRRRPRYDIPEQILRQLSRRRWTKRSLVIALVLLAVSVVLDRIGTFRYRGDDWAAYDKHSVICTRVVDGDTIHVRLSTLGKDETVRLLGIDAPEISHNAKERPAHFGPEATHRLETLIEGKPVTLRLDATQTRDKYHRLLAYVHAGDAENVNLELVREGYAYAHRIYPHSLQRQFEQAEDDARGKHRGLWADVSEQQMPEWRQHWLSNRRGRRE